MFITMITSNAIHEITESQHKCKFNKTHNRECGLNGHFCDQQRDLSSRNCFDTGRTQNSKPRTRKLRIFFTESKYPTFRQKMSMHNQVGPQGWFPQNIERSTYDQPI